MRSVTLELPWPPSLNRYYRSVPTATGARAVLSREGREYRAQMRGVMAAHTVEPFGSARVAIVIYAMPPDRRRRDLDNIQKGMLDSIEASGLIDDDSQIDDLRIIRRSPAPPEGKIILQIREIL